MSRPAFRSSDSKTEPPGWTALERRSANADPFQVTLPGKMLWSRVLAPSIVPTNPTSLTDATPQARVLVASRRPRRFEELHRCWKKAGGLASLKVRQEPKPHTRTRKPLREAASMGCRSDAYSPAPVGFLLCQLIGQFLTCGKLTEGKC